MSDIVKRLRNEHNETDTKCRIMCLEAANEIERLRELFDILLQYQFKDVLDTKPSDSPTD